MSVTVRRIVPGTPEGDRDMVAALEIREEVFVGEQGVTPAEEHDGLDALATTTHVLAVAPDGTPVGTARLLTDPAHPGVVHVGRVAVRRTGRGLGVGRALMAEIERAALTEHAVADGAGRSVRVELSAQETAIPFYEVLGYRIAAERYLDARIWHRDASKVLRA
ncbi:GNAT family N-acetyltransferase [Pseudactinotalea suaedae]|uniref:GNAT family N-acetyltransferase n=1 Tax=Pseudactinotalea suaedae TaxID=1524924 RepID=UPI0012E11F7D|nr:GNAT family N-acetyltransferase [Pseudactinotalea suaedae]